MPSRSISPQSVICPNCGKPIPLSEALTHQIRENLREELAADYDQKLAEERVKLEQEARKAAAEANEVELQELREQLKGKTKEVSDLKRQELQLRKDREALEDEKRDLELTVQRKMDEERKQLWKQASEQAEEKYRLAVADLEKQLADVNRQLEEAKRKAAGGSPQTGGKVQEKVFADLLRERFPDDDIREVKTGARGADVLQVVTARTGQQCGTILWESKRTKSWGKDWIGKLKQDQGRAKADIAALVSAILPFDGRMELMDGVWVTDLASALDLAAVLRMQLEEVSRIRASMAGRDSLAEQVYDYVSGPFVERVKGVVEPLGKMRSELDRERTAMEKMWAQREGQIRQVFSQMAGMVGDLMGIGASLPEVKALELPAKR